ncbi:HNH endonuclease [Mesorhizobium sp. B2-4-13]|uniref:HNH endonuclease n=1 Tax=Mesorhizobium sp. B2-4-13 TaxID=2589936 RepID=UPI0015EE5407|nr:HNH endonuclease [Mesorhizobium sp. B2-4-13]
MTLLAAVCPFFWGHDASNDPFLPSVGAPPSGEAPLRLVRLLPPHLYEARFNPPTIKHKKARIVGGLDELSNLAAACFHCNRPKSTGQKFKL